VVGAGHWLAAWHWWAGAVGAPRGRWALAGRPAAGWGLASLAVAESLSRAPGGRRGRASAWSAEAGGGRVESRRGEGQSRRGRAGGGGGRAGEGERRSRCHGRAGAGERRARDASESVEFFF